MTAADGNRTRILIREPIADAGVAFLRERFDVDIDLDGELADKIGNYDAIIVRSGTQLTSDLIDRAERLKVIGRAGVGWTTSTSRPPRGESWSRTRLSRRSCPLPSTRSLSSWRWRGTSRRPAR